MPLYFNNDVNIDVDEATIATTVVNDDSLIGDAVITRLL